MLRSQVSDDTATVSSDITPLPGCGSPRLVSDYTSHTPSRGHQFTQAPCVPSKGQRSPDQALCDEPRRGTRPPNYGSSNRTPARKTSLIITQQMQTLLGSTAHTYNAHPRLASRSLRASSPVWLSFFLSFYRSQQPPDHRTRA